ncbi:MAG: polysaccharide biosynthesis C-terminal domain-containing protein [Arcobacter sp.]|nr:polysaccharide biosynthesis C-terminal domain-containing protein [Arcobacter sp.]
MPNQQILKNTNATILNQFNASLMFDKKLYAQDIKGSIAHSKMLALQGIISIDDQEKIEIGLLQIKDEIENGEFIWKIEDEDIHMAIENRLSQIIGSTAGRLHTARSRNDQVATDFTLYVQDKTLDIKIKLKKLIGVLVNITSNIILIPMVGITGAILSIILAYGMSIVANLFFGRKHLYAH